MPNERKFGNSRVVSIDGKKIWAPPQPDMIPYLDDGPYGGVYWAEADATREDFEIEDHPTVLSALGWEEVEAVIGIPLRQIVARKYDGFAGENYWLVESSDGTIS